MRIRIKLSIVELTMAVGFFIAISVSLFYLNSMIRVKNMEYQAEKVVSSLARFNYKTEGLLTHAQSLSDLRNDWSILIEQFEKELKLLKEAKAVGILDVSAAEEFLNVDILWDELTVGYLEPIFKQLDTMIETGLADELGSAGVLQTYYTDKDVNSNLKASVFTLRTYRNNLEGKATIFAKKLEDFIIRLQSQSEQFISTSLKIVAVLVIVTIILSMFVINLTARRISGRIGLVEDAVQTLTKGDFSKNLTIKSGDEFEELANHYNIFKGELWKKLDSILEFMLQIGESISEGVDINSALDYILVSFIKNTTADAGAVFMVDEDQKYIDLIALDGFFPCPFPVPVEVLKTKDTQTEYLRRHSISLGETIIGKSIKSGDAVYLKEIGHNELLTQNNLRGSLQYIHSIAVIPLIIAKRVLGAVALVKTTEDMAFTDMEFTNMKTFGDYAALTIDNMYNFTEAVQRREMQRELKIASDIQKNLLPRKIPDLRTYSIGVHSEAARAMSGDYYDIYRLDKDRIALIICDVVGKGVPASLLMVMIRTVIRFISSPKRDAEDILNVLNKGIIKRIGTDQYATLSVTVLNEVSGEVSFSNAGHSPLLHFSQKEGLFVEIDTQGLPVGVEVKESYIKEVLKAKKDDIFVLYTDGLPDPGQAEKTYY